MWQNKRRKIQDFDSSSDSSEDDFFDDSSSSYPSGSDDEPGILEWGFCDAPGPDELNDNEFTRSYRLKKSTFNFILELIQTDIEEWTDSDIIKTPENDPKMILMFAIGKLITKDPDNGFFGKREDGIGKATGWRMIRCVVNALYSHRHAFIKWPDAARAEEISEKLKEKYKSKKPIGLISRSEVKTFYQISRMKPKPFGKVINRTMPFQIISDHEGQIMHVATGEAVASDKVKVLRSSRFENVPIKRNFVKDDHLIGVLKDRIKSLKGELPKRRVDVEKLICACCVLHNIYGMLNDQMPAEKK
ncbi:protein ANTAGONIST OF LIKE HETEROCHROMATIN PROTEIN 1-like [Venturia canescens]|uniref:protein ANTAGONIST OF LIKE HETEROCHROMATIN PROTEIN 1-like n=1 Tax=Venturia canescens TaxID=32260 RepID=UPI001C9CD48F|nr:protein ANTAGONIST OF LIKE HETEROCHROMATIN PROTEIN 1-like [Venturia canescens]